MTDTYPYDIVFAHDKDTHREASELLRKDIDDGELLAIDTETTGLDWRNDNVRLLQMHVQGKKNVYVFDLENVRTIKQFPNAIYLLCYAIDSTDIVLTAHNAMFDLLHIAEYMKHRHQKRDGDVFFKGYIKHLYENQRILDTAITAKIHRPDLKNGLKDLAEQYLDIAPMQQKALKDEYKATQTNWDTIPVNNEVYVRYAAHDAYIQAELANVIFDAVTPAIDKEHFVDYLYQMMSYRGVRIDVDRATELVAETIKLIGSVRAVLADDYGILSLYKNAEVAEAIKAEGVTLRGKTPTNKWKVDAEKLEEYAAEGSNVAKLVLDGKKSNKMLTWLTPLSESNGIITPSVKTVAAITGRSSISNPPLQQLPREDTRIRELILADDTEHEMGMPSVIVSIDYSQIELRVLAALSQDSIMKDIFEKDIDMHSETSISLFGDDSPFNRHRAKAVNFGILYGIGANLLSKNTGQTQEKAQQALQKWSMKYREADRWRKSVNQNAAYSGEIKLPDGRTIPADRKMSYRATNYMIQGTAALLLKRGVMNLHDVGLWDAARLVVHDEVVFSFLADEVEQNVAKALDAMALEFRGVAMPVEATIHGERWGGKGE